MSRRPFHLSTGQLLVVLFLLMLLHPFISYVWVVTAIVSLVVVATMFGLTTIRWERVAVIVGAVLFSVAGWLLGTDWNHNAVVVVSNGIGILFFGGVLLILLRSVFKTNRVDHNALFGAASIYLIFSVMASRAFVIIETLRPGAFVSVASADLTWIDFQYFSLVTLTTLGYGDIQPVDPLARAVTMFVAVSGVFYMAFLVARLVAMHNMEGGSDS